MFSYCKNNPVNRQHSSGFLSSSAVDGSSPYESFHEKFAFHVSRVKAKLTSAIKGEKNAYKTNPILKTLNEIAFDEVTSAGLLAGGMKIPKSIKARNNVELFGPIAIEAAQGTAENSGFDKTMDNSYSKVVDTQVTARYMPGMLYVNLLEKVSFKLAEFIEHTDRPINNLNPDSLLDKTWK